MVFFYTAVMPQNIVIIIDYSAESEDLIKFYFDRLHRPENKLVLVHCIQPTESYHEKGCNNLISAAALDQLQKEEEDKRNDLNEKVGKYLREKKVPGILRSAYGRPRDFISRVVNEVNAAYVVVNDNSTLSATLSGKVWRAVTRGATGRQATSADVIDALLRSLSCPLVIMRSNAGVTSSSRVVTSSRGEHLRNFSGETVASLSSGIRRIRFASGSGPLRSSGASSVSLISAKLK